MEFVLKALRVGCFDNFFASRKLLIQNFAYKLSGRVTRHNSAKGTMFYYKIVLLNALTRYSAICIAVTATRPGRTSGQRQETKKKQANKSQTILSFWLIMLTYSR